MCTCGTEVTMETSLEVASNTTQGRCTRYVTNASRGVYVLATTHSTHPRTLRVKANRHYTVLSWVSAHGRLYRGGRLHGEAIWTYTGTQPNHKTSKNGGWAVTRTWRRAFTRYNTVHTTTDIDIIIRLVWIGEAMLSRYRGTVFPFHRRLMEPGAAMHEWPSIQGRQATTQKVTSSCSHRYLRHSCQPTRLQL